MTHAQRLVAALKGRRIEAHTDHRRGFVMIPPARGRLLSRTYEVLEEEAGRIHVSYHLDLVGLDTLELVVRPS